MKLIKINFHLNTNNIELRMKYINYRTVYMLHYRKEVFREDSNTT